MSGRTKGDIVNRALSLIGISPITVEPDPSDIETALFQLETMVSRWLAKDLFLGYIFSMSPQMDQVHNVAKSNWNTLSYNLARKLCLHYAMPVPPLISAKARKSMNITLAAANKDQAQEIIPPARQPIGLALELRYGPYRRYYIGFNQEDGTNARYDLNIGDVRDYKEDFTSYLTEGELVDRFIVVTNIDHLTVSNTSKDGNSINYRVTAGKPSAGFNADVIIRITTNRGRIATRLIKFDVTNNSINDARVTTGMTTDSEDDIDG